MIALVLASLALIGVIGYSFIVANDILQGCRIRFKLAWIALMLAAGWLLLALLLPQLHECQPKAIAAFSISVVILLLTERRGKRYRHERCAG